MMRTLKKTYILASILLMLSACSASQYTGMAIVWIGYTIWTDKLPTDKVLEIITKKDCNTIRAEEEGGEVCREFADNDRNAGDVPLWCYRTIGGIDCYNNEIPQYSDRLVQ